MRHRSSNAVVVFGRAGICFLLALLIVNFGPSAEAADFQNRSIRLSSPSAGEASNHTFSFTNPTVSVVGSIVLQYCANSPLFIDPCAAPAGLDATAASLASQTGNVGFVKDASSTASRIVLSRAPAGSLSINSSYTLNNVINPTLADQTFFGRISMHASSDGSGPAIDQGAVAFSTSGSFNIGAYVPPFLIFCVGVTVAPDCSSTTGNLIDFGVLAPTITALATTQFAGATNDFTGYQVFVNGQTMTSGNNAIPELTIPGSSSQGVSQFGLNLRLNNAPVVGNNPSGSGTAVVDPKYNTSNLFAFGDGDKVVSSPITTDFNVFTQSYLVNVSALQKPGVYATTLLYTAVASF
jgi:hypothetical protein